MRASMLGTSTTRRAGAAVAAWLAGVVMVAGAQPARTDVPAAPDHLTLIENLTTEAAQDVVTQLAFAPGTTVHLVAESQHPANWLVERALARWLTAAGCRVIAKPSESPAVPPSQPLAAAPAAPTAPRPVSPGQASAAGGGATAPGGARTGFPEEGDSLATAAGDSTGAEGEQAAGEEQGDQGQAGGETLTVVQRRRLERQQQEAQQRAQQEAQQLAQAAASQGGAAAAGEADLEHALPAEGEVLLYRVAELEVSYPWVKRSWVVGPRRYGRLASVRIRASHLTQPEHRVSGVAQGDRVAIDEFPGWARSYLEGARYPFTIEQPEQKPMRRFIEPIFVVAVVSGLVYLFYENQK